MIKELSKLFGETSLPENKEVHGSSILLNKERIEITYYERSKVEIDEEGYELPLLSYTIDLVLVFKEKILTQQWENAMT